MLCFFKFDCVNISTCRVKVLLRIRTTRPHLSSLIWTGILNTLQLQVICLYFLLEASDLQYFQNFQWPSTGPNFLFWCWLSLSCLEILISLKREAAMADDNKPGASSVVSSCAKVEKSIVKPFQLIRSLHWGTTRLTGYISANPFTLMLQLRRHVRLYERGCLIFHICIVFHKNALAIVFYKLLLVSSVIPFKVLKLLRSV